MEIVSLIIMAIGLVALVAIYLISRLSRKDLPQNRKLPPINTLRDEFGEEISSIQEDHPARDGKLPNANAPDMSDVMNPKAKPAPAAAPKPVQLGVPQQLIMFIAAEGEEFAGRDILEALEHAGLSFGDMGVFHRMVLTEQGEHSLFYVANGVKPWTLVPAELEADYTPGLSMILNLPSPLADQEAVHDFVRTAQRINDRLGGVLKNQQQEAISDEDLRNYFATS